MDERHFNICLYTLSGVTLLSIAGMTLLSLLNLPVPPGLTAVSATAIGGIAAIIRPPRKNGNGHDRPTPPAIPSPSDN